MLSSVHLSWRSPYMLRGSSIAPVTFGQSTGYVSSFDIFGHSSLCFPSTLLLFLPLMFLLYLSLSIFIYLYLSLSIFISSTILPSWDCNIFTDFRFTSFVSGHTFVIRNRSRVATSLTGGSPITLTQLFVPQRRWNSLLHGYNRSQATSPPNHIIMNRYDSLWFIWFNWFITIHYDSLWFIVIHASCCISRPLQIAGDCINVITQRGAGPYVLSTHDSPRKRK